MNATGTMDKSRNAGQQGSAGASEGRPERTTVIVQKYGGTSVSTPEARDRMFKHVQSALRDGHRVALVVSAMGRGGDPYATDTLLDLLKKQGEPIGSRNYAAMFCCGEMISAALISHMLNVRGIPAACLNGAQAGVCTNDEHGAAEIVDMRPELIQRYLSGGLVPVITGCQGVHMQTGDMTTLGRGGSDTSGVAVAAALKAERSEIFTDVDGVYMTDPRIVPQAPLLRRIGFEVMHEMALYGASVMHPRAVSWGWRSSVPIVVRSTFSDEPGTTIDGSSCDSPIAGLATMTMETASVDRGIASDEQLAQWEQAHLFHSFVDMETSARILGVDRNRELVFYEHLKKAGIVSESGLSQMCWVSVIGDAEERNRRESRAHDLLEKAGITTVAHDVTRLRTTYVVPVQMKASAVRILFDEFCGSAACRG